MSKANRFPSSWLNGMVPELFFHGSLESFGSVDKANEESMKHKVFAIYDDKAKAYLPPFFMHTVGMAVRVFADCVNTADHAFNRHPGDYTLFEIGEFDDVRGVIDGHTELTLIANGLQYFGTKGSEVNENA